MDSKFINKIIVLFLVFIIILLFSDILIAQFFVKSYDFPVVPGRTETGKSIVLDLSPPETWSIAGISNGMPTCGGVDWMFLRLNNNGNIKCSALLGLQYDDSCYSHIQLTNYNYVLAGAYLNPLLKPCASFSILDTNCNHIISKQINDTSRSTYMQVIRGYQTGSFTLTGFMQGSSPAPGMTIRKIIISQYMNAGALMWGFRYMSNLPVSSEEAYSICYQITDNSYAVTGKTNYFSPINILYDVFVMKITSNGIPVWMRVYRFPATNINSEARKIIPMPDGGFVITGWTNVNDAGFSNIWIFRIASNGNIMWSYTFGTQGKIDQGHSVILASDNTLVLTGYTNMGATEDEILAKFPVNPMPPVSPLWVKTFDRFNASDRGFDLKEAANPVGYGVTGQTNPAISNSLDPYLMRTNSFGFVTQNCVDSVSVQCVPAAVNIDSFAVYDIPFQDIPIVPSITHPVPVIRNLCIPVNINENGGDIPDKFILKQNYPNPFNSSTNFEFSLPEDGNVLLKLYDIRGREVYEIVNGFKNKGTYIASFNGEDLPSGLYFYILKTEKYTGVKRMIIVK